MFPFRYKLTLLVSVLVVTLLSGIFLVVQNVLEKEFIVDIKNDLKMSNQLVAQLMDERRISIQSQTTILSVNHLVREIYTDKNLDRDTANDLVMNEILPNFPLLRSLSIVSPEGQLLAADPLGEALQDSLFSSRFFSRALTGETVNGHLFFRNIILQFVGTPVFLREELIGVLFAAAILDKNVLNNISEVSGVEMLLFNNDNPFISTRWAMDKPQRQQLYDNLAEYFSAMPMAHRVEQIILLNERYLYIRTDDDTAFTPRYLLSISLDRKLAFSRIIYNEILIIGFIGILIGIIVSFLFARSVSRPILQLQAMTRKVENEDFSSRVLIQSNDEFSQLGDSFNKMISGLQERKSLEIQANMDSLTGIPNRRRYDKKLTEEWSRAMRSQSPLSIALLDIDYFKPYNDNYGHAAGDDALKSVASAIATEIRRSSDFCARYGGEEFVLVLPDTDEKGAKMIAELVRKAVEEKNIRHEHSNTADHITISIGGSTCIPEKDMRATAFAEIADEMLYQAKEKGRNQVVWGIGQPVN